MSHCIFCKIISGEEYASKVYEDDDLVVFMDAYPLTQGHCLIIPKSHHIRLDELKSRQRAKLFSTAHRIIEAQKKAGLGVQGTNLLINDGKAANQTVPHLHLHLIPRESGDLIKSIPKLLLHISGLFGLKTARKTLDKIAEKIAQHL